MRPFRGACGMFGRPTCASRSLSHSWRRQSRRGPVRGGPNRVAFAAKTVMPGGHEARVDDVVEPLLEHPRSVLEVAGSEAEEDSWALAAQLLILSLRLRGD